MLPWREGFPGSSVLKNPPASAGDARNAGSIPESGRSSGVGSGNPLQYSCLENPMERRAYRATVRGVTRVRHDLVTNPPPPLMGGTLADRTWYL